MAKCPYCGNDTFHAHQICHLDVLVGEDGQFVENDSPDGFADDAIYEGETPFGPFTCTHCGAEFEDLNTMAVTGEPVIPNFRPFVLISETDTTKTYKTADGRYQVHICYQGDTVISLYAEPTVDELIPFLSTRQGGKLALHLMAASKQYAAMEKMIRKPDPEMRKVAKILCASTKVMDEVQAFFLP